MTKIVKRQEPGLTVWEFSPGIYAVNDLSFEVRELLCLFVFIKGDNDAADE